MEQVLQAACLSCGSVNSVKAARITRSTEFIRGMSPVSLLTSEGIDVASFTPALSLSLSGNAALFNLRTCRFYCSSISRSSLADDQYETQK